MRFLLLGNGFDLSFGLPTRYVDFIKVVDYLSKHDEYPETAAEVLAEVGLNGDYAGITILDNDDIHRIVELAKDNIWLRYFISKINDEGDTWIDFEQQLSFISGLFMRTMGFTDGRVNVPMSKGKEVESKELLYLVKEFFETFFIEDKGIMGVAWAAKYRPEFMTEYPPKSGTCILDKSKVIEKLHSAVIDLSEMLKLYLKCFVDKPVSENINALNEKNRVRYQRVEHVLTFNYTNTYEMLFSQHSQIDVKHLHGNVDTEIVLGYNPDSSDYRVPANTDLLAFKKYYQRAYYDTNRELILFNNIVSRNRTDVEIIVMGFSLSRSDEDIIRTIFEPATKITVYCHSDKDRSQYLHNLVEIYGKEMFDELVYGKNLRFITGTEELKLFFDAERMEDFL